MIPIQKFLFIGQSICILPVSAAVSGIIKDRSARVCRASKEVSSTTKEKSQKELMTQDIDKVPQIKVNGKVKLKVHSNKLKKRRWENKAGQAWILQEKQCGTGCRKNF